MRTLQGSTKTLVEGANAQTTLSLHAEQSKPATWDLESGGTDLGT